MGIIESKEKQTLKLRTIIMLLVIIVVLIAILITNTFIAKHVTESTKQNLSDKILTVARMTANSEVVINGLINEDKKNNVQPYASEIQSLTNVGFVVVLDMNLIRLSHPIPSEVGKSFYNREDAKDSLNGKEYFSVAKGPLGVGMRVFTPVFNQNGKQIGVVVVGVSLDTVKKQVKESQKIVIVGAIIQLVVGLLGALLISKYIKKILFGLEPVEIAKILEERNIVIESVNEGIIAVNKNGYISVANSKALRLMNLDKSTDIIGKSIDEYIPLFKKVLKTGKPELNYELNFYGSPILANCTPILVNEKIVGGIATFRDKSEVKQLVDQLTGIQQYTESLRAQYHEFMNKLHVILGLIYLKKYDELDQFIVNLVDNYENEFGYIVQRIKNPVFSGFLLGKMSKARENGIRFIIDKNSSLTEEVDPSIIHHLITIAGNLIENAFDAVKEKQNRLVTFFISLEEKSLHLIVEDNGYGISKELIDKIIIRGVSTKGENRGYGLYLTNQAVKKLNGKLHIDTNTGENSGSKFTVIIPIPNKKGETN